MATAEYDVIAEAEKALYVANHRAPKNVPLDKARAHGTAYQSRHCGCQACSNGFGHVAGMAR